MARSDPVLVGRQGPAERNSAGACVLVDRLAAIEDVEQIELELGDGISPASP
jgi:hypothetical protein